MTETVSRELLERAYEMACRELAEYRSMPYQDWTEDDVAYVQREFIDKATGFEGEAA